MDGLPDKSNSTLNKLHTETDLADNERKSNEIQLINAILKTLQTVQKKYQFYRSQRRNIRSLCNDIDSITNDLKMVTRLDNCKELETSLMGDCFNARVEHEKRLKQANWWEKLDICET